MQQRSQRPTAMIATHNKVAARHKATRTTPDVPIKVTLTKLVAATETRPLTTTSPAGHGRMASQTAHATPVEKEVTCKDPVQRQISTATSAEQEHTTQLPANPNPRPVHHSSHQAEAVTTQPPHQENTTPPSLPEDPNRSVVPDHITQLSPVPSACNEEMLKAWITRLDQNHAETKETQDQNRFLDNIDVFDGEDKTKCLPWVNRVHQAAMNSSMKFRKALLAKAGPTVFGIVAHTPIDIKDLELKQVILANFSDISTP